MAAGWGAVSEMQAKFLWCVPVTALTCFPALDGDQRALLIGSKRQHTFVPQATKKN